MYFKILSVGYVKIICTLYILALNIYELYICTLICIYVSFLPEFNITISVQITKQLKTFVDDICNMSKEWFRRRQKKLNFLRSVLRFELRTGLKKF